LSVSIAIKRPFGMVESSCEHWQRNVMVEVGPRGLGVTGQ
jgi:hypothetical protein